MGIEQNTLTYAIIIIGDVGNVDFNDIAETGADTIRKSIDESQFVIKWITEPPFITDGTVVPVSTMDHDDVLTLMATPAWTDPNGPH